MAESTKIEWADATWNPWYGCRKVSAGCKNCYAERDMTRYGRDFAAVTRAAAGTFNAPLTWAKPGKSTPYGKLAPGGKIFTCSWSDWFIEEADDWRAEAWAIVRSLPQFNFLILTKRPERIAACLPSDWGAGYRNVWLGTSAEDQANACKRIPLLLAVPAAVHFLSAEPLLGPIDLKALRISQSIGGKSGHGDTLDALLGECTSGLSGCLIEDQGPALDWVISGGESGTKPRPMHLDWARGLRDQCTRANVSFFHKQHGGSGRIDGTWGGRLLDGIAWNEFPWLPVA